jgi:hypothetical protein
VDEDVKNLFASTYNINKIGSKLNYYKIWVQVISTDTNFS